MSEAYETLVWDNARVFAKKLDEVYVGKLDRQVAIAELAAAGVIQSEIDEVFAIIDNDPDYEAITWGTCPEDEERGVAKKGPYDECVYETLKEYFRRKYFRRIHKGNY